MLRSIASGHWGKKKGEERRKREGERTGKRRNERTVKRGGRAGWLGKGIGLRNSIRFLSPSLMGSLSHGIVYRLGNFYRAPSWSFDGQ